MAPPVEAAPTDPDVVFAIGSEVLLEGLVNKPQLNGRFGEIVSVLSNGRFGVRLWESTGSLAYGASAFYLTHQACSSTGVQIEHLYRMSQFFWIQAPHEMSQLQKGRVLLERMPNGQLA